jgi:kynurenine 3-monooxygenase
VTQKVIVVGAGLAGSLLAIYLAKRGIQVDVFEARGDMRKESVTTGRSINLALSNRGIAALKTVGLDAYMLKEAVPMQGRMIHSISGETKLLPYSGRKGEYINSVSRSGLNAALISEAERYPEVQFIFSEKCTDLHLPSGEVTFESGRTIRGDTVIATDGAGSVVRRCMQAQANEVSVSSNLLEHGYKELHIPSGEGGAFQLAKNALHIWPRHKFMMIALPNADGSFTCTLFVAHRSDGDNPISFDELKDETSLIKFFKDEFSDAYGLMPTLAEDFAANPTGQLGTIKCSPWNIQGKVLLLGDSAHAMVPFYGQGMNCAFEDVAVLDRLIERHGTDWNSIYEEYSSNRSPDTDAIQTMAQENFYEMRDAVSDVVFQRKRELETKLEQIYPDYFSKYSMVTFREDLPYSLAKRLGNAQDQLLMGICSSVGNVSDLDLENIMNEVRKLRLDNRQPQP